MDRFNSRMTGHRKELVNWKTDQYKLPNLNNRENRL